MSSKLKVIITSLLFMSGSFAASYAEEINYPGFTGNVNTTVTTGLSVRIDRNCLTVPGEKDVTGDTVFANGVAGFLNLSDADRATFMDDGEGCASRYTDGYGNAPDSTSGPTRKLVGSNADDGNMNFDGGDIFDSTTRVFSEISGTFDNGVSLNASVVGSYNPITSFTNPTWAPFSSEVKDDIETNIDVLDFYITTDIEEIDATLTAGNFVTNWGEATFIPIGLNGLVTNAVDLTKLRVPGSSIREALMPTSQITLAGYLDNGWSYEAYYQLDESHVELDKNGTYFSNEVAAGDRLVYTSAYSGNSMAQSAACGINIAGTGTGRLGLGCTEAAVTAFNTSAGSMLGNIYTLQEGFKALSGSDNAANIVFKSGLLGAGAPAASGIGGASGDAPTIVSTLGLAGVQAVTAAYQAWDEYDLKGGRKAGSLDAQGIGHAFADGDDQYGIALRTYLDNVGSGVDLGFYYAQYDSKTPYLRFNGQGGIHAHDLLGFFTLAAACATELVAGDGCDSDAGGSFLLGNYQAASGQGDGVITSFTDAENTGLGLIANAITDVAYGEAACGAYQNPEAVDQLYNAGDGGTDASNFGFSSAQKNNALTYYNYTAINGKLYHDSTKCFANAQNDGSGADFNTAATQMAAAALLGAAITPLNVAQYEFIYPENNQILGMSASTNIGGTTVQGEITYRPDFPLATDPGDQGNQLSDAAGTTTLLSIAVAQGARTACRTAYATDNVGLDPTDAADQTTAAAATDTLLEVASLDAEDYPTATVKCAPQNLATSSYRTGTGDSDAEWADVVGALKNMKRSSLPAISMATVAAGDYNTTAFIEQDVFTVNIGTTSTFTASHPLTQGLGADSSVFLAELGIVHVDDLDYANDGGIARNGYRDGVGGEKCGGVTNGGAFGATNYGGAGTRALDGVTHIGAGQTDPLFGNGSYCESQNTIDATSMTYRLIGSATYNNIANTPWSFSPSFVWSHDFSGYGPRSIGGFVPGKQSLSLGGSLSKGDVKAGLNYVNQLGDPMNNDQFDRDYVSASVSYAF
mgnify:CR=1 FL=1